MAVPMPDLVHQWGNSGNIQLHCHLLFAGNERPKAGACVWFPWCTREQLNQRLLHEQMELEVAERFTASDLEPPVNTQSCCQEGSKCKTPPGLLLPAPAPEGRFLQRPGDGGGGIPVWVVGVRTGAQRGPRTRVRPWHHTGLTVHGHDVSWGSIPLRRSSHPAIVSVHRI